VVWSLSDFRDLQSNVDSLVQWISDMTLNSMSKTQTVVVDGHPLEKVQSYKYLGDLISSNLSSNHVSNNIICSRAKKHTGRLYRRSVVILILTH